MLTPYEKRQKLQDERKKYREAARRLNPTITVPIQSYVATAADDDGAFVDCVVWVPKKEIES